MRTAFALLLASVAAYTFSFAIDLLLGGIIGDYPNTAFLPAVTWSVITAVAFVVAWKVAISRYLLAIPFAVFGVLAFFGALAEKHPQSFGVALMMFLQTVIIWRVAKSPHFKTGI